MARTEEDAFSYAASSWIKVRMTGTSVVKQSDGSCRPGNKGSLPSSVAKRMTASELPVERDMMLYSEVEVVVNIEPREKI